MHFKFKWQAGIDEDAKFPITYYVLFIPENDPDSLKSGEDGRYQLIKVAFGYPNTANKEINTKDLNTNEFGDFENALRVFGIAARKSI